MNQTAPAIDRQSSDSVNIPERRIIVKDPSDMPANYCQTPGGTIFSTTPGGTRIIYDRHFLLQMKNSPLSRTPPVKLATIPDIISEDVVTVVGKAKISDLVINTPTIKDSHPCVSLENSESGVFSMD